MIRAPYRLIERPNLDRAQATGTSLFLAGYGLERIKLIGGNTVTRWGYRSKAQYIGCFLLSLPSRVMVWRQI